ncbi:winged helix-turn-helix transcriptional regulator [Aeromicrobium chenweiae]|uniref:Transcriptional regulator n=1 Tax=Aeromicrobium chenweiae TaxID=2079793 RepID=A0A2S0WRK2_9ACTN|nr:helix-turn-helix domain-containing protein [Aeromicrobium chenweiae]AWB93864.1 transcriptional regulator [Aeromicrobium chenweiae]TGN30909.1 transcriptional regulator [Aeromicrobium chenweiae]
MTWTNYDSATCSIARTAQVLGDRWTVLVVRDLFNGVRRFDALQDHLGISRDVLTKRLQLLVDEGLAEKRPVRADGERTRHEYVLTEAGRELRTILVAIMDWGDRHRAGAAGPPVQVRHAGCGEAVHAQLVCDAGHEIGARTRTELVPLDGARLRAS